MKSRFIRDVVKETFNKFGEDRALRLSAALAYYAIFSIGPFLLIVVGIAGLVVGNESVRQQVDNYLRGTIGPQATGIVDSMMNAQKPGTKLITTIVGIVAVLLGAGGVFGQLQDALNTIWQVKPKPGRGIKGLMRDRFLSLTMVLGSGFLLLISMVLSAALAASTKAIGHILSLPTWAGAAFDLIFSFAVITTLFAMMFRFLPDVRVPWRNVWGGAMGTALLFTIGKFLLGFYLGRESTASAYGAAGAVVIILMWVYYASIILFIGAEFTQVYTHMSGVPITPTSEAVPVGQLEREQQGMPSWRRVARGTPRQS
jgi:membrane protein